MKTAISLPDDERVTARLNEVCAELDSSLAPELRSAASRLLLRERC